MGSPHSFFLVMLVMLVCGAFSNPDMEDGFRQKRLFSVFNLVKFKNEGCSSSGSSNLDGTCLTSSECSSQGGSISGNCAAGFGVCCVFSVNGPCGSSQRISHNSTYIQNNGYPSPDTMTGESCVYNFDRICDNLCQIRLDFDTLMSQNSADGSCGTMADSITVSSPFSSSTSASPPVLCGTLTGQHIYFETGTTGNAGELTIDKGMLAGNRNYKIKVTYYTCDDPAKAPQGCTQYFTGLSGSFQSYNYAGGQLLQEMDYSNCFRREEGYCQIQIRESTTMTPDPFLLSAPDTESKHDCASVSFISFSSTVDGGFCGGILNTVAEQVEPSVLTSSPGASFQVGVHTLADDLMDFTGFNLIYNQVPC